MKESEPEQIEWWMVDLGLDKPVAGFWRSTVEPDRPRPAGLRRNGTAAWQALEQFRSALPGVGSGWPAGSALAEPEAEGQLARSLGRALLPDDLLDHLAAARQRGARPILRVHASGRVTDIPWETLAIDDDDTRLIEVAQVRMIPPPAVPPAPSASPVSETACAVLDPKTGTTRGGLGPLVDPGRVPPPLADLVARLPPGSNAFGPGRSVGRCRLRLALQSRPAPLLYFGHVSAETDGDPAGAAIHLTDGATVPGRAAAVGGHRPLSARDLMKGPPGSPGPFPFWPMPPRVALIGCGSGREQRSREPFGLVSAALATGARMVTATRWALPTDLGLEPLTGAGVHPTSRLVAAVNDAQAAPDSFATLTAWKRRELDAWRTMQQSAPHPGFAHSPLLWGALADFEDFEHADPPWPDTTSARDSAR